MASVAVEAGVSFEQASNMSIEQLEHTAKAAGRLQASRDLVALYSLSAVVSAALGGKSDALQKLTKQLTEQAKA